ncbi:MAG: Bacterial membrane flanked domain protein [Methanosaeta sp. PtaB.Bin039]|nr:MAG: Bacterial membrane flanked domain protein [Methanosaeta sp. PtaB.Bin039]HOT06590.1 PH domain-containing protein [Methanotrichaceae archaeon]HQF16528.1 PH domain-containing protein [Methanotrichaceae archaeon]HQI91101.1 PH domain-containing protein [Methanotrichaceae archaeon]HQJ28508.1 PH domain-containing protein [Methanotrichaceae archaeon]
MQYLKYSLMEGEQIYYETSLHRSVILWPVILSMLLLAFPCLLIVGITWIILVTVNYITSEFVVTNRRLSLQTGILRRQAINRPVDEVGRIDVEQGALGSILGYGTLVVPGASGEMHRFSSVSRPFEFKRRVQEQASAVCMAG